MWAVGTTSLVGASSALGVVPASATGASVGSCVSFGSAGSYSEYSTSTALVSDDTTDGSVAYGGQASLTGDSFATASVPAIQQTFVAGGAVSGTSVTLNNGSAIYVGPLTSSITDSGGTVTQVSPSALPFQFSSAGSFLASASTTLGGLSTSGTIVKVSGVLTLTGNGTGASTNVFDVNASGSGVSGVSSVVIDVPSGGVAVVNLQASTLSLSQVTVTLKGGVTADDVVFNLPTATSLTLDHDTLSGTVLAPMASVTTSHLVVAGGGVLVDLANFANDTITGPLFAGCVPIGPDASTPEVPKEIMLPAAGVAVFGAAGALASRRRHRKLARAGA
jgi:choice-of-anchor A domain-containing protein